MPEAWHNGLVLKFSSVIALILACAPAVCAEYDIAVNGGRVIDPESGLDRMLNVGVTADRIVLLTESPIEAGKQIDASGLTVAPGFIDIHQHGQSIANYEAQVRDGITTALELEIGVEDVAGWYADRAGKAAVNYGASISHPYSRQLAMLGRNPGLSGESLASGLTAAQYQHLRERVARGLDEGALAVGFGIAYTPGATRGEITAMFRLAAEYGASCHVHMRTGYEDFSNLEEVVQAARETGARLHIVHINSSARDRVSQYLERILAARAAGVEVTTECYPYNRGSTLIQSHLFNDWESYADEQFGGYIWVETGETLTRETFGRYRARGGTIITPPAYSEESVRRAVADPLTIIASDGMWLDKGRAHPRSFGTYSRVLGRYVREMKALTLTDALRKMTFMPAQLLEKRVPEMRNKGRIRPGADADIVVFDADTIIDRGTFDNPARSPAGIEHVLVNGVLTVENGKLKRRVTAGRPVRARQIRSDAPGTTWRRPRPD